MHYTYVCKRWNIINNTSHKPYNNALRVLYKKVVWTNIIMIWASVLGDCDSLFFQ